MIWTKAHKNLFGPFKNNVCQKWYLQIQYPNLILGKPEEQFIFQLNIPTHVLISTLGCEFIIGGQLLGFGISFHYRKKEDRDKVNRQLGNDK